jgi:hypothetical protein
MALRHNNGIGNALTELLGDAIRDTRSKLIDEAWFGRPPSNLPNFFEAIWGRYGPPSEVSPQDEGTEIER